MGLGESLVRTLMFVFNAIFFLLGLGLAIIGGLVVGSKYIDTLNDALPAGDDYSSLTYAGGAILAFGLIVLIVSFLGCCGALKHNKCMLYTFALLMGIFVLCQVVVGILAFVYRGEAEDAISDAAYKGIKQTNNPDDDSIKKGWDELQQFAKCCGVRNYTDWVTQEGTPFTGATTPPTYPDSCCQTVEDACATEGMATKPIWTTGCYHVIYDEVESYGLMIGLGAIIFALLQVLGIVFACCLGQTAD